MEVNIEHLPFGVAVIDKNTLIIETVNDYFCKIFSIDHKAGITIEECQPLFFLMDIIEEGEEEYRLNDFKYNEETCLDIILKNSKDKITAYTIKKKSQGSSLEGRMMSKLLKLREERQEFITISTELKSKCEIIEILRKREKEYMMHLKDVMNNISEGLIVLDNKGKYNFCNKSIYSIIDVSEESLKDYPNIFSNYIIEKVNDVENTGWLDYIFNNKLLIKNVVILLIHKDTGERKFIEFNNSPIKDENDEFVYSIVTMKDVTDIKLHERLVQEQAAFINDVINTMDIPVAVVSYPLLEITLANGKLREFANKIFGNKCKNRGERSLSLKELLIGEEYKEINESILNCGNKGVECSYSPFELNDDGEKRYYKIKFKPLKDRNKNTNLILISAMDITEETCRSMHLENITNMKDEFFSLISHELRTPLTVIHSSLQLAYNVYGKEITPNIHKNMVRISQNCSRLLKLINNILDITKAEAGFLTLNISNFDIVSNTEYVVNSINSYAKVKDIELIFISNRNQLYVNLDKDKYEKILLNLLSNAMKFTPSGKKIITKIEEKDNCFTLSVSDQGIGIPKDKIESIFDRFAQVNSSLSRRAEGTGLGLSLVKKFVELMGGSIEVKSTVDVGTEFILSFKKLCIDYAESESFALMDVNMEEKINIEFSDID
ncbi:ATP-binding protein [Clostridium thermarum]|uniref:ATP-binding protein n=1 Tax=Clostridium thermarum TaxID=1716543 RepID=UPI0013D6B718|nr:ATP-binding protein [Clostridium thermarum]